MEPNVNMNMVYIHVYTLSRQERRLISSAVNPLFSEKKTVQFTSV